MMTLQLESMLQDPKIMMSSPSIWNPLSENTTASKATRNKFMIGTSPLVNIYWPKSIPNSRAYP